MDPEESTFDAWNPGLESDIPQHLNELITLFRWENGDVSYSDAMLGAKLCGLKPFELCSLSVKRLVIHELLVRVTADLSVPDGPKYEDKHSHFEPSTEQMPCPSHAWGLSIGVLGGFRVGAIPQCWAMKRSAFLKAASPIWTVESTSFLIFSVLIGWISSRLSSQAS